LKRRPSRDDLRAVAVLVPLGGEVVGDQLGDKGPARDGFIPSVPRAKVCEKRMARRQRVGTTTLSAPSTTPAPPRTSSGPCVPTYSRGSAATSKGSTTAMPPPNAPSSGACLRSFRGMIQTVSEKNPDQGLMNKNPRVGTRGCHFSRTFDAQERVTCLP
jgi:hypothetical protein